MPQPTLKMGVVGMGRAFTIMVPTFVKDPRLELVAGADPRAEARAQFEEDFNGKSYEALEPLLDDTDIDAVYLATPASGHLQQIDAIANAGKHILIEKPLALTLPECQSIIELVRNAGVQLIVGHSHSFDLPIRRTHEIITGGTVGDLRMVTALNFTDFMYRARRPDELITAEGGGVVFSQAAHQIDIIRLLGGGLVTSVRAATGNWDPARPSEGAYNALLTFENGVTATAVYSGYAHFDTDELMDWTGEGGAPKDPDTYWTARDNLAKRTASIPEAELKASQNYGGANYVPWTDDELSTRWYQHFGTLIVSCEKADLRPMPWGVAIYGNSERRKDMLPRPAVPRAEVIDELTAAIFHGTPPRHSGEWAMASLEVCLAILESARLQKEIVLQHQCSVSS